MSTLTTQDVEHIFEGLRKGLVPERGIDAFAVGIDKQRQQGHSAKPDRGRPARMYCFRGDCAA